MDNKQIGGIFLLLGLAAVAGVAVAKSTHDVNDEPITPNDMSDSNTLAFLRVLRVLESNDDYSALVGGGNFKDYSDHPANLGWKGIPTRDGQNITTAAGAYQITRRTFNSYKDKFGVKDFMPASQDLFAIGLLKVRGALPYVQSGNFQAALSLLPDEWESVKFMLAGQYHVTLDDAARIYADAGGIISA